MGRPLGRKCPRAGVRVRHPGGDTGVVTKVLQPSGQKKACAGDLVYVQWDAGMVVGVPRDSLERTRAKGGLGSLTLGDVWRMNPAGREGPPMAAGRVIDVQPGDYVVNDQNLEPIRLPQYRSASQLLDKLQDEWALAQDKYGILERDRSGRVGLKPDRQGQMFGLGDNHDWTPRQYAEALDPLNRRVFVTSVEGDHAIVVPAQNFSRGLPLRVPLTSLRPLRGLGMEWDGSPQPGRRGDPGRRWRVVPHVGVETKPQWASTFFPTGILLKDINPALAKYPGDLVPVPEWNHLSESYIEEEPGRWGHESNDPGAIVVRDGIRHKLWPREDLQLMLAAEDHYRGIMPPETTFKGLGSTDAEHATDFDTARFELVNAVNDAQLALRQGQCRVASTLVGEADVNYGRLQANAMTTASMGTALDLFKQLAKVQTEFDEKCVRDEPVSESYDRTMRAMRPGLAGARMVTIPAAHLREDVKEARGMVKELQRGIKRDVKALGADIGWFPKAGRDALDPMGRVVYIVRIDGDMATVKLGGSYGAHVQVPVTALREPPR